MTEDAKQKLIEAAKKRLDIDEEIFKYFAEIKRITTGKQRTKIAEYKDEIALIINEKTALFKDLQNHVFQEPQINPLESFCDAQEKEINDLKKENKKLSDRIVAIEKMLELMEKKSQDISAKDEK